MTQVPVPLGADRHAEPADVAGPAAVVASEPRFTGRVWSVRTDRVDLGDGQTVVRDVVEHPGAVGIIALDDHDRVLLVRQYRHPVRAYLWEAPAGLLDIDGEDPLAAARRELFEEAGVRAGRWNVLIDYFNSPGFSSEVFRCYLARDIESAPEGERFVGVGEEREMPITWISLDSAVGRVIAGELHNPTTVSGILAADAARRSGFAGLRPAEAPWPARDWPLRSRPEAGPDD